MKPTDDPLPIQHRNALIRRLRPADLSLFQAYRADPELGRFQGWSPLSDVAADRFLREMAVAPLFVTGQWFQMAIAEPGTDRLIGDIGLSVAEDASHVEIGFTLAAHAQGHGRATAAVEAAIALRFASTSTPKVLGITDARNTRSIRLLLRVGMQQIEQRQALFKGEPCRELVFSRWR